MTTKKTETVSVPKLVKITGELHAIFKRGTADVIQIGRLLRLAKKEIGHGEFLPWLEKEFSLSEKSAQRYMAAHKFMINVAAPLLKSDKLSDLRLRPSALYELVEMHSRGTVTQADIEAVLKEAAKNWIGSKRLKEILKSRHPVEATPEATSEAEPEVAGEAPAKSLARRRPTRPLIRPRRRKPLAKLLAELATAKASNRPKRRRTLRLSRSRHRRRKMKATSGVSPPTS